jgi:predicted transcriptional regulator
MANQTKIKRTYSLEPKTVELIEHLARQTRRGLSTIVDIAVEAYAQRQDDNGGNVQVEPARQDA